MQSYQAITSGSASRAIEWIKNNERVEIGCNEKAVQTELHNHFVHFLFIAIAGSTDELW